MTTIRPTGRTLAAAGLAGAGLAASTAVLVHDRSRRAWATAADPCGPEGLRLPEGREHEVVTDEGATLGATVAGPDDGPVVVLAHCYTCDRAVWGAVARRLVGGGHRVALYDHRGHGDSTSGSAPVTVSRLGSDLRAVMEQLELSDAVVAGHSMGGMAAQAFAVDHPEEAARRARALVLVASSARPSLTPATPTALERAVGDRAMARMPNGSLGHAVVRYAFGASPPPVAHLEYLRSAVVATLGRARVDCGVAIAAMDLRPALGSVRMPTTVVVGSRDMLTPPAHARGIARRLADGRLVVLAGAGHMLPMEEPDAVAGLIEELAR